MQELSLGLSSDKGTKFRTDNEATNTTETRYTMLGAASGSWFGGVEQYGVVAYSLWDLQVNLNDGGWASQHPLHFQ